MVKLSLKVMSDKNTTFRSDDDRNVSGTCFYYISATASLLVFPPTSPVPPLRDDALNRYKIDRVFQITPWHYITTSLQKVKVKDFL